MKCKNIIKPILFILGTELVGLLSAIVSGGGFKEYYNSLIKPPLSPPHWLFPIAWAILYALMGLSAYLIYDTQHKLRDTALIIYFAQLFVNFLWSPVFFRFQSLGGAVFVIILLLVMIIAMIALFWQIRKSAAALNLPYLLWVMYATYLTIGFYVLN